MLSVLVHSHIGFSKTGVTDGCELAVLWVLGTEPSSVEEQPVLLTSNHLSIPIVQFHSKFVYESTYEIYFPFSERVFCGASV